MAFRAAVKVDGTESATWVYPFRAIGTTILATTPISGWFDRRSEPSPPGDRPSQWWSIHRMCGAVRQPRTAGAAGTGP